jgi:hypothetical protein
MNKTDIDESQNLQDGTTDGLKEKSGRVRVSTSLQRDSETREYTKADNGLSHNLALPQFDFSLVNALVAENITAFERVQLQCLRVRARRYGIRERAGGTVQERFGSQFRAQVDACRAIEASNHRELHHRRFRSFQPGRVRRRLTRFHAGQGRLCNAHWHGAERVGLERGVDRTCQVVLRALRITTTY